MLKDMIYFQRKLSRLCCHSLSERTDALVNALVELWDASVRASHYFLAEEDIRRLVPCAGGVMQGVDTPVEMYQGSRPVGVMGAGHR